MKNKPAPILSAFFTPPQTIAATCKTIEAAKKDLAGILKQIADNNFAVEKVQMVTIKTKSEIDALAKQTPADRAAEIARKREDLAAAFALGKRSAADLEAFEKEVSIEEKSRDRAASLKEQIRPLEVTIAGLRRELGALESKASCLQAVKQEAARDLCKAGFEACGVEYLKLGIELRRVAALAVAYGSLHKRLGGTNRVGEDVERISLMPLGTDSTHNATPFFSDSEMVPLYNAAEEEILAGLAADGLELFPAPPKAEPAPAPPAKVRVPGIGEGPPVEVVRPEEPLRTGTGHLAPAQAQTEPDPTEE